jgi:hypothetical protein
LIANRPSKNSSDTATEGEIVSDDLEALMKKFGASPPSRSQMLDYIASRHGDPEAIYAAGVILGDLDLLREAATKDPNNPQFIFALAIRGELPAEERLTMTTRLLELQPDNAFGSYLLAIQHFNSDHPEAALEALRHSLSQPDLDDYSRQTAMAMEDALRGTGSTGTTAQLYSAFRLPLPYAFGVLQMTGQMDLKNEDLPAAEIQERRHLVASIGTRFAEAPLSNTILTELVGLTVQSYSNQGLPEESPSTFEGLTVAQANASVLARRNEIRNNLSPDPAQLLALPREVFSGYTRRLQSLGEFEANRWVNRRIENLPENREQVPTP